MDEKIENCILCNTKCKITQGNGINYNFNCENCGEYVVTIPEIFLLTGNQNFIKNRHLLSGVSYYNTVSQLNPLHISSKNWEKLITNNTQIPTKFSQKSDLLLMHMYDLAEGRPNVHIKKNIPFPAIYGKNSDDLLSHYNDLKSQYFITYDEISMPDGGSVMRGTPSLSIDGVKKIEELRETNSIEDAYLADETGNQILTEQGKPIYLEGKVNSSSKVNGKLSIKSPTENTENKEDFVEKQAVLTKENETSNVTIPANIFIKESNDIPKLEIETIAEACSNLINNTKIGDNRGAFGVLGKWGRGKSYFIKYLIKNLEANTDFENIIVNFSAWQYQKTPEIWAYLYEKIAQKRFYGKFKLINIFLHNFYKNKGKIVFVFLWPILWIIFVKLLWGKDIAVTQDIIVTNNFLTGFPPIAFTSYKIIKNSLSDINKIAITFVKKYTTRKSFEQILGLQKEIQDELRYLLQSWIWEKRRSKSGQKKQKRQKKIILIVDDVDRCNPDNIIELLDTLRVVLDDPEISKRLKVIIAIDHLIVSDIMKNRFNDFFKGSSVLKEDRYIRDYFDKLFLFSLHLAPLEKIEREQIINSIYETSGLNLNRPGNSRIPPNPLPSGSNSEKRKVNRTANPLVFTPEVKNNKIISEFQPMSDDELRLFKESISELDCTPRRIRILYYRYVFIKCLIDTLEKDDFTIDKSMEVIEKIASYEKKERKEDIKDTDYPSILNWVLFD